MTKRTRAVLSEQRDLPLLGFLWRWKMATTAGLARALYPQNSVNSVYMRLWKLEKAGFICTRNDIGNNAFVWTLDKKGYAAIRPHLPPLREDGYMSENLRHDLIVSAIHFGERIFGEINGLEFWTEQELRRIDPTYFPQWVTKSERHRPDGYWHTGTSPIPNTVALEVELSAKVDAEYDKCARFYDDHSEITAVLWIVQKPGLARKIHSKMERSSRHSNKHSFVMLDPVSRDGWQSPIVLGHRCGSLITDLLLTQPKRDLNVSYGQFSLDIRKSPHKSKHSRFLSAPSFSY